MPKKSISVDELLKSPTFYHQKTVLLKGYFINQFENQSLWPSVEVVVKKNLNASIWIEIDKRTSFFNKEAKEVAPFSHKNVVIKGIFIYEPTTVGGMTIGHGHMGGWPAELQKVTLIQEIE